MAPDHDQTASEISNLLERLAQLQRSWQQGNGLNPAQWAALRYFARANRYSQSATALTEFLGATKGTVSQTLNALERKRLVTRHPNPRDRRAHAVELTPAGRELLRGDPLKDLDAAVDGLMPPARMELRDHLAALLAALQQQNNRQAFGICHTCHHFRRGDAIGEAGGPHRCGLTREPLAVADIHLICAEHQRAA